MNFFFKTFIESLLIFSIASCSMLNDILPTEGVLITEVKDPITDDIKYTSKGMVEIFDNKKPIITTAPKGLFAIEGAIKLNPYLLKTKEGLFYYLQASVTGSRNNTTKELMIRCDGSAYASHKFSPEDIEGSNKIDREFEASKNNKLYYQEEIFETKIAPDFFNYLVSCSSNIQMRAKGQKTSIDSTFPVTDPDWKKFQDGLKNLRSKATEINASP